MIIVKYIFLLLIFMGSSFVGVLWSKKYKNRVAELREFKNAINILESKIRFTYEPLKDIFTEISRLTEKNIAHIFKKAVDNMQENNVKISWESAIDSYTPMLSINKEDISVIKNLGKMLR